MIKFSKDKVLLLHQLIAEETGGSIGVRDVCLQCGQCEDRCPFSVKQMKRMLAIDKYFSMR